MFSKVRKVFSTEKKKKPNTNTSILPLKVMNLHTIIRKIELLI